MVVAVKSLSAEQKSNFKEYGKQFQSQLRTDFGISVLKEKRDHVKHIQKKLSVENLTNMDSEVFINLYKEMWASRMWHKKSWYAKNKLIAPNSMKKICLELKDLLYSKGRISERYDKIGS